MAGDAPGRAPGGLNAPADLVRGAPLRRRHGLLGIGHEIAYEGGAAILLEGLPPGHSGRGGLPGRLEPPPWDSEWPSPDPARRRARAWNRARTCFLSAPFAAGLLADLGAGLDPGRSGRPLPPLPGGGSRRPGRSAGRPAGADTVALGGGVFQNLVLLELAVGFLEAKGLRVLIHREVPTNDGGLSLGQAEIAAARLA